MQGEHTEQPPAVAIVLADHQRAVAASRQLGHRPLEAVAGGRRFREQRQNGLAGALGDPKRATIRALHARLGTLLLWVERLKLDDRILPKRRLAHRFKDRQVDRITTLPLGRERCRHQHILGARLRIENGRAGDGRPFSVSVPVLSAHSTSTPANSSTAGRWLTTA